MDQNSRRITVLTFYFITQIIIYLTPPQLSLFTRSTKSCTLAKACWGKKKRETRHQNSRDQNMRYWHNEVEKTALGPSVQPVYHFIGTNLINKIFCRLYFSSSLIWRVKEALAFLFSFLDQLTSHYYFKRKASFSFRKELTFLTEVACSSEGVKTQIFLQLLKLQRLTNVFKLTDTFM